MEISELALQAQVAWFHGLAASGFPQISAGEGFAPVRPDRWFYLR